MPRSSGRSEPRRILAHLLHAPQPRSAAALRSLRLCSLLCSPARESSDRRLQFNCPCSASLPRLQCPPLVIGLVRPRSQQCATRSCIASSLPAGSSCRDDPAGCFCVRPRVAAFLTYRLARMPSHALSPRARNHAYRTNALSALRHALSLRPRALASRLARMPSGFSRPLISHAHAYRTHVLSALKHALSLRPRALASRLARMPSHALSPRARNHAYRMHALSALRHALSLRPLTLSSLLPSHLACMHACALCSHARIVCGIES